MIHAQTVSFRSFDCRMTPTVVNISRFQGDSGVEEYHLMVCPTEYDDIAIQLEWVFRAYQSALVSLGLEPGTCLLRRFFCSDLPNQAAILNSHRFANQLDPDEPCAVSWVCQPPTPPAKVALWAYHVSDPSGALKKSMGNSSMSLDRGELTHIWTTGITCAERDTSYEQTEGILERYESRLQSRKLSLADHAIRTWFFVQNVDANYQGLVEARKEIFSREGLTPDTHFIASTGIGGSSENVAAKVLMDAYAISGVQDDQIEFLSAPSHLSPTHVYGVTFERGVSVAYRDRKQVFISGTASINSAGEIVHKGSVLRQLDRTLENVEALLKQAGGTLRDVCVFIVYVRDPSDLDTIDQLMRKRFASVPIQVVVAPVCRPGWLIEIECQATLPTPTTSFPAF